MNRTNEQVYAGAMELGQLRLVDAVALSQSLRKRDLRASCQQEVAERIVRYLYEIFCDPVTGERSCALVRCFQTHRFEALPPAAQQAALRIDPDSGSAQGLRCLALLATCGQETEWNDPETSAKHRAIPLRDVAMVEQAPMIARLLAQMGIEPEHVVEPHVRMRTSELQYRNFGVFHVENAVGSPYLPSQQTFIEQYGIRSVVGMGGLLPSSELFAVILFAKVEISPEVAALFRTIALSVKLAFIPFAADEIFLDCAGKFIEQGLPIRIRDTTI